MFDIVKSIFKNRTGPADSTRNWDPIRTSSMMKVVGLIKIEKKKKLKKLGRIETNRYLNQIEGVF